MHAAIEPCDVSYKGPGVAGCQSRPMVVSWVVANRDRCNKSHSRRNLGLESAIASLRLTFLLCEILLKKYLKVFENF